ncbi:MAG: MutS-related protein, partial [Terriglobales bacterium]
AAADLALVSVLLARLEREQFESPLLQSLTQRRIAFDSSIDNRQSAIANEVVPSVAMARLKSLVNWADSRHSMFVRFLDVPLLYSLQVAFAIERWRKAHGHSVRRWLEALGQIEALASLAAFCYEHPNDPFPELLEQDAPLFAGEDIGHPLIPAKVCVRNSIELGGATQALLVSGSNMSGKSTFLRTIGTNAVLALAGAPVRARSLRLTRLQLGCSIRVTDSLQAGRSGFYAEITRLRQIMDLTAQSRCVLFLADELLHGTNSHDRRIGAEGLIRALLERGAIGVVTTHDLAITEVAGDRVRNAHFQDELRDGRMSFDYRLREGVVTRSNALELMRTVGLDV